MAYDLITDVKTVLKVLKKSGPGNFYLISGLAIYPAFTVLVFATNLQNLPFIRAQIHGHIFCRFFVHIVGDLNEI